MDLTGLFSLQDFEELSYTVMDPKLRDYVRAGASDEVTLRQNKAAFEQVTVKPRIFRDVSVRDQTTEVLGKRIDCPIMLTPAGGQRHAHPDGELAAARASERAGTVYSVPTISGYGLEEIAESTAGRKWFQIGQRHREAQEHFVRRAEAAGYEAIILTADAPVPSRRESDLRNQFSIGSGPSWGSLKGHEEELLSDPVLREFIRGGATESDLPEGQSWSRPAFVGLTWNDIEWFRDLTDLPIIVKGVRSVEDAIMCAEAGFNGVTVSNHGARHIDGTKSAIELLPRIADAVGHRVDVFFDSGIRRGLDVFKALALGAKAVLIGRPIFWGLAVGGENGVSRVLDLLQIELDMVMAYVGTNKISEIDRTTVDIPREW